MANAFILFGLLIAANAYFFIRSRRKARESQGDTEVDSNAETPPFDTAALLDVRVACSSKRRSHAGRRPV